MYIPQCMSTSPNTIFWVSTSQDSVRITQGSILGSLLFILFLFILFINDLPLDVSKSTVKIYADDTTQVAFGRSVKEVETILTHELRLLSRLADENKLVLNHSKTKSMTVCSKPKFRGLDGENLKVRNGKSQLDSVVRKSKLLGIKLNNCLTWENQMAQGKEQIGKRLGLLKRTKEFLSLKARTLFYNSIIQPILDYGAVVWGSNKKEQAQDIVKLQKRCARIILHKNGTLPRDFYSKS